MRRGLQGAWFMAGLAMLGAMIVGQREAEAGSASGTIGVTGGIKSGGGGGSHDPPYIYVFDIYLTSGSLAPDYGMDTATVTIQGLVGVSNAAFAAASPIVDNLHTVNTSATTQPPNAGTPSNEFWALPSNGIVTSYIPGATGPPTGTNFESSVTWEYIVGPTFTVTPTSGPVFLGEFTVETGWNTYGATDQPTTPVQVGSTLNYSYDVNGSVGSSSPNSPTSPSIIVTNQGVPEPSSMLLMLVGGAVVPYLAIRQRRRSPRVA